MVIRNRIQFIIEFEFLGTKNNDGAEFGSKVTRKREHLFISKVFVTLYKLGTGNIYKMTAEIINNICVPSVLLRRPDFTKLETLRRYVFRVTLSWS